MMNGANELDNVQKRLNEKGVRDVKFFFTPNVKTMTKSVLKQDVAYVLSTYLDGYKTPLSKFGDSQK